MKYSLQALRGDLFGGITATVVALPGCAGLRGCIGPRCGRGPLRRRRRRFFRADVRRYALTDFRTHGADDRCHGCNRHQLRLYPGRSAHGGGDGRPATGAAGPFEDRALRGVHASCGRLRIHVRNRHHRHADAGAALFRHVRRAGGRHGRDSRLAATGGQPPHQRLCDRGRHARGWRVLAPRPVPARARSAGRPGGRHAAGRAVAE